MQFCTRECVDEFDDGNENSYRSQRVVDDEVALLDVLDTTGQEEYSAMRDQYLRTGEGFVLVYSFAEEDSFHEIRTLHDQIHEVRGEKLRCIIVGSNIDPAKDREVRFEEGKNFARELGHPFIEMLPLWSKDVEKLFQGLVRDIRNHRARRETYIQVADSVESSKHEEATFWLPQVTPDGKLFYFNTLTGVSQVELPLEAPTPANYFGATGA